MNVWNVLRMTKVQGANRCEYIELSYQSYRKLNHDPDHSSCGSDGIRYDFTQCVEGYGLSHLWDGISWQCMHECMWIVCIAFSEVATSSKHYKIPSAGAKNTLIL